MITLQRLLSKSFLIGILFSISNLGLAQSVSCTEEFDVLLRHEKYGYEFAKKPLTNLLCNKTFEGKYFKIVVGTSEQAISFDEKPEIIKKAANVYYHLSLAREFWVGVMKSEFVANLKQITIRLEITNSFSNVRHFRNEGQEQNHNNAWTIPEGHTPNFVKPKEEWYKEIWFSPMKKIEARKQIKSDGENPIHQSLLVLKDPIFQMNKNALIYQVLGSVVNPVYRTSSAMQAGVKRLFTLGILFGLVEVTKYMDNWFRSKYYYIDTAMIPDIIYHEFAHVALSDTLKPTHSVPVIEGMADYFAALVSNKEKMYEKIKEYSNNNGKNLKNRSFYHPYLEEPWNATSDFTVSLLWKGKKEFNMLNAKRISEEREPIIDYDQFIYKMHYKLSAESNIMKDLTGAMLDTCKSDCKDSRMGLNALHHVFEEKGLN